MIDSKKIIEESVLYTSLCFQLLDSLEELVESGDDSAQNVVNSFFDKKGFTYEDCAPLMRIPTTLGIMASVVFFVKNNKCNLSYQAKEHITT
jgi:hypothetical protein